MPSLVTYDSRFNTPEILLYDRLSSVTSCWWLKCQQMNTKGHTGTIWLKTYFPWEFPDVLNLCQLKYNTTQTGLCIFIFKEMYIPLFIFRKESSNSCWNLIKLLSIFLRFFCYLRVCLWAGGFGPGKEVLRACACIDGAFLQQVWPEGFISTSQCLPPPCKGQILLVPFWKKH